MVSEPVNLTHKPHGIPDDPEAIPFHQSLSFFLFSGNPADSRSRFHWIASDPIRWIRLYPNRIETNSGSLPVKQPADITTLLKSVWQVPFNPVPWQSGWFFLLGYELAWYLSDQKTVPPDLPGDHCLGVLIQPGTLLRSSTSQPDWRGRLVKQAPSTTEPFKPFSQPETVSGKTSLPFSDYQKAIRSILNRIREGDTYEVNFCYPVHLKGLGQPDRILFNQLKKSAGSSFLAYVNLGVRSILSGSPERFFSLSGNRLTVQPMKGTRRRQSDTGLDDQIRQELTASEKDRAENLMIVDLMRNDLGRICQTGSVETTGLFEVESYPTVHQMISTVSGSVAPDVTFYDVLAALFPPGSMTGAPKRKTMEIIREMEPGPRGFYSGIVGYWDGAMEAETSVLIRCVERTGSEATLRVGGGIVADSDPHSEYGETLVKLKSSLTALGAGSDSLIGIGPGWEVYLR